MRPQYKQLSDAAEQVGLEAILALLHAQREDTVAIREALTSHAESEAKALQRTIASLTESAFPDGDTLGHREYHLAMMEAAKNRAEFWRKLLFELTKWGLLGFLGWLVADLLKAHLR